MNLTSLYQSAAVMPTIQSPWLQINSTVFQHGGVLPSLYRSDGLNINPALHIAALPGATKSLLLMLLDSDAPISARLHWICWDLPPTTQIQTNEKRGIAGINDFQLKKYVGPCGTENNHKYYFLAFALNSFLCLPDSTPKILVERSMESHVLAMGSILFFSPPF